MGAGCQERFKHTIPPARSIDIFKLKNGDRVETFIERINVSWAIGDSFETCRSAYRVVTITAGRLYKTNNTDIPAGFLFLICVAFPIFQQSTDNISFLST